MAIKPMNEHRLVLSAGKEVNTIFRNIPESNETAVPGHKVATIVKRDASARACVVAVAILAMLSRSGPRSSGYITPAITLAVIQQLSPALQSYGTDTLREAGLTARCNRTRGEDSSSGRVYVREGGDLVYL